MKYRLVGITTTDRWGESRTSIEIQIRKWYGWVSPTIGELSDVGGPFPSFQLIDSEGIAAIKTAISQIPEKYKGFTIIQTPEFNVGNLKFREMKYIAYEGKSWNIVIRCSRLADVKSIIDTCKPEVKTVKVL